MSHQYRHGRRACALLLSLLLVPLLIACAGSPASSSSAAQQTSQPADSAAHTAPATTEAQASPSGSEAQPSPSPAAAVSPSATAEPGAGEAAPAVTIPDTPAGRALAGFLEAFNSGDQEQQRRYVQDNIVTPPDGMSHDDLAGRLSMIQKRGGTMVLSSIEEATDTRITFVVQLQLAESWMRMTFAVEPQPPHRIAELLEIEQIEPPAEMQARKPLSEAELRQQLEGYFATLAQSDGFWGTVLVAKDGVPVFAQALGMANQETQRPNQVDTVYKFASIGKMFTAVAIGQLLEQGKLRLEDRISAYLPDYPGQGADKVQIRHLLGHASGIPDVIANSLRFDPEKVQVLMDSPDPHKDYAKLIADLPLDFEPGSKYDYNNTNFLLLGAIIARVSGQSYYDYIAEHIFEPAGMQETFWHPEEVDPARLAWPHVNYDLNGTPTPGQLRVFDSNRDVAPNGLRPPLRGDASGGGYATVGDLLKFFTALREHSLLGEEFANMLFAGAPIGDNSSEFYAYGFRVLVVLGKLLVGHEGFTPGVNAQAYMYPGGYDVVILSNTDFPLGALRGRIDSLLLR